MARSIHIHYYMFSTTSSASSGLAVFYVIYVDPTQRFLATVVQMFYYWVNFGPLSRGSAACGYVVLWGLMAAAGWRLTEPLPPNIQMDWEAILRPNPEAFLAKARPWLKRSRRREDILEGVPEVTFAIPTALEAIRALNGP